ncbi:hypothetical protein JCM24511_07681 [Saitozyma sp. JCM 24511]|nr:hypothetical protein JCM24511_07681 [Saitozyma sp. JCM 24511]
MRAPIRTYKTSPNRPRPFPRPNKVKAKPSTPTATSRPAHSKSKPPAPRRWTDFESTSKRHATATLQSGLAICLFGLGAKMLDGEYAEEVRKQAVMSTYTHASIETGSCGADVRAPNTDADADVTADIRAHTHAPARAPARALLVLIIA